jgi:hypothetical protein
MKAKADSLQWGFCRGWGFIIYYIFYLDEPLALGRKIL